MKLKRRLIITIAIFIILAIGGFVFFREGTFPVEKNSTETKIFVINRGEKTPEITNRLKSEGLIRNRIVFFVITRLQGIENNIQAGVFRLSPSMDAYRIAKELTHGSLDVSVTLLEGWRKEEIAQEIGKYLDIPESEFVKAADEGYMFPDTYFLAKTSTADDITARLKQTFQVRFRQAQQEVPKKNQLTDQQVVTLASLVERETRHDEDRPQVADILLKRMNEGHKLQVDATVQYALGYQADQKSWWKKGVNVEDTEIDSTYNTYRVFGLPPSPICNPGLESLKAALSATGNTPYLFYIHDNTGKIHVAKNSEEHQRNIDKYLK